VFDLFKDVEKYKGIPPYASEHYGVYQPLIGWQSKMTKGWLQRGGVLLDPRITRILDQRLTPGPQSVLQNDAREFLADPLQPAAGRSPFIVSLTKNLNSEVLNVVRARVQAFVDSHNGQLRFSWSLGPEAGPAVVEGVDFCALAADGRLEQVVGFIDKM